MAATNLVPPLKNNEQEEYEEPINIHSDGLASGGFYPQGSATNNMAAGMERDESGNLVLKDGAAGSKTLSELAGSSGFTAEQHKIVRQLIHFIEEGPAEGFASGAYCETLPAGDPFPTSSIWYESSAKLKKIVEETVTYNSNKTVATDQWKIYGADGSTVLATVTDTLSYSGIFETSRTRTIA